MVRKDEIIMICPICHGKLIFNNGIYICESCGREQTLISLFENTDVFICYTESDDQSRRTKDSILAQDIYNYLQNSNINTFYQRISAADLVGDDFLKVYFKAISDAKIIIFLATSKKLFQKLLEENRKYIKNKKIFPVYSDIKVNDIPKELAKLQAINYDSIGAKSEIVKNILHSLGRENELIIEKKNNKKRLFVSVCILLLILIAGCVYFVFDTPYILKSKKYEYAGQLENEGHFTEAMKVYSGINSFKDSDEKLNMLYNRYDGYYIDDKNNMGLYIDISSHGVSEIELHYFDKNNTINKNTSLLENNKINFSFKDSDNKQCSGVITLKDNGFELCIDDNISQFDLSEKTDMNIKKTINGNIIKTWLESSRKQSYFYEHGYSMFFVDTIPKFTDNAIYQIDDTNIQLGIFYDSKLSQTDRINIDGDVVALLAPASIACPSMIGKTIPKIKHNKFGYEIYGGFIDANNEIVYYPNCNKIFAATNDYQYFSISFTNNDSELSVIDSGTMIAVTSKKWLDGCEWITDNNWDDLAANCIEYD